MDYQALKTLIMTHPQWPGVSDAALVTWVNAKVVGKAYPTLTSGTIFAIIAQNIADFTALSADQKQLVRDILYIHTAEGVPTASGTPARTLLQNIFAGTATLTALGAAVAYNVSRGANAGLPRDVALYDMPEARRLAGG